MRRDDLGSAAGAGAAYAALGVPAGELADRRVDLSDLITVPAEVPDRAPGDPAGALEHLFMTLWARADPDRRALGLATSLDRAARSGLSIREIALRHELSERGLHRLSERLFGYGPKALASIHRFQHALRLARAGTSLSESAVMAGYADQSHLNRETRRLAATTPGALLP